MNSNLVPAPPACALDHILGSAVTLNWDSLATQSKPAKVRVEYQTGSDGAVDFLKIWACGREYWSLVCDYSPHAGWSDGPRFSNGYHSRSLGRLLQAIIMNQDMFRYDATGNTHVTVEIGVPTADEITSATQRVQEAFPKPHKA